MAITLYSMGYLYSVLFHVPLQQYYPFLVSGMLGWTLISTLVIEFSDGLLTYQGLIRQIKLPYTLHIHRIAARNLMIFLHNILVIVPVYIIFSTKLNWSVLLLIPGIMVIYINAVSFGMLLAMTCARFRDMSPLVKSVIQVIFFVTPVMWKPDMLENRHHLLVDANPFYAILELIRAPLMGNAPALTCVITALIFTLASWIAMLCVFVRYRSRIIYWL